MDKEILKLYPWLKISNSVKDYVEPAYYDKLLKPYVFNNKTDLKIFNEYIKNIDHPKNILELCCGSGRVSQVALKTFPEANFTYIDLSQRMLSSTNKKLAGHNRKFIQADAVDYLSQSDDIFDFAYTLWGFSHSVHQHIHEDGIEKTKRLLNNNISKFIEKNLEQNGKLYIVHFDSMSEEQSILMQQWKRVYKAFANLNTQSPSKLMLDDILINLDNHAKIYLTIKHLDGDPIVYKNENELLEIFLNFHLETYFNNHPLLPVVLNSIKKGVKNYAQPNGQYAIRSGCYIYEITKR